MSIPTLETKTETDTVEYAESKGVIQVKLNLLGRRGWPDRLFMYPVKQLVFVEFKRENEPPRKLQEYVHGKIRKCGFNVIVVDNISHGKSIIDQLTSCNP